MPDLKQRILETLDTEDFRTRAEIMAALNRDGGLSVNTVQLSWPLGELESEGSIESKLCDNSNVRLQYRKLVTT